MIQCLLLHEGEGMPGGAGPAIGEGRVSPDSFDRIGEPPAEPGSFGDSPDAMPERTQPADPPKDRGSVSGGKVRLTKQGGEPKSSEADQDKSKPAFEFFKDNKAFGGRFDSDEFQITEDWLAQQPKAVQDVFKSYHNAERELSRAKSGHMDRLGIKPEEFEALDFSVNEGRLPEDTRNALVGRVINEHTLEQFESAWAKLAEHEQAEFNRWSSGLDLGGPTFEEMIEWAGEHYDESQLAKFEKGLNDPDVRDVFAQKMAEDMARSLADMPFATEPRRAEANLKTGRADSATDGFQTEQEYHNALFAAKTAAEQDAVDAKLRRSTGLLKRMGGI